MKYIKKFVDKFKKDDYQDELPDEVLFDRISAETATEKFKGRTIDFPNGQLNDITEFIERNLGLYDISINKNGSNEKSITINTGKLKGISKIQIIPFDDEWFLTVYFRDFHKNSFKLALNKVLQVLDTGNANKGSRIDRCDTLDGVKQSLLNFKKENS